MTRAFLTRSLSRIVLVLALGLGPLAFSGCAHGGGLAIGVVVVALPDGYTTVTFARRAYYMHDGLFYRRRGVEFMVVAPPVGATVVALPRGHTWATVGTLRYGLYRGVYYRPLQRREGATVWVVADIP